MRVTCINSMNGLLSVNVFSLVNSFVVVQNALVVSDCTN